jgi:hypothetical protein
VAVAAAAVVVVVVVAVVVVVVDIIAPRTRADARTHRRRHTVHRHITTGWRTHARLHAPTHRRTVGQNMRVRVVDGGGVPTRRGTHVQRDIGEFVPALHSMGAAGRTTPGPEVTGYYHARNHVDSYFVGVADPLVVSLAWG